MFRKIITRLPNSVSKIQEGARGVIDTLKKGGERTSSMVKSLTKKGGSTSGLTESVERKEAPLNKQSNTLDTTPYMALLEQAVSASISRMSFSDIFPDEQKVQQTFSDYIGAQIKIFEHHNNQSTPDWKTIGTQATYLNGVVINQINRLKEAQTAIIQGEKFRVNDHQSLSETEFIEAAKVHSEIASEKFTQVYDRLGNISDGLKKEIINFQKNEIVRSMKQAKSDNSKPRSEIQEGQKVLKSKTEIDTTHSRGKNEEGLYEKPNITLELVNIAEMIDIFSEQKALQEFDITMGNHNSKGFIAKHFSRARDRFGRGAWIEQKKQQIKRDLEIALGNGELTEHEIKSFLDGNEAGIYTDNFLEEEQVAKNPLDEVAKDIIEKDIFRQGITPEERKIGIQKLRQVLQSSYTGLVIDLRQLERSLAVIEGALISTDLATLEIGLNLYDIGRIGNQKGGNSLSGVSQGGTFTKIMDKMDKHIASRIASSPTIAALVSALGIQGIFGRSLATFGGGLIGGSLVGGVFAGGRATRESRDEIQSALRSHAYNGTQQAHNVHQGAINKIISIIDGRNIEDFVRAFRDSSLSITDKATLAREYYARREATRDTGYNFLLYPNDKAAMLNVEILEDLKTLGLGKAWRTSPDTQESMANLVTLYHEKAKQALDYDLAHRKSYALKQGALFGGSAFAVGGALGALQYGIHTGYSAIMNMPINEATTMPPSNTISSNTLGHGVAQQAVTGHQALSTIDRNWLQNGTPAPIFDGNELGIHQLNNGDIEVSSLSHEVSTQGGLQDLFKIGSRDYYAIVTMPDGVHYKIDINSDGVLVPDDNMKTILSNKSFSTLEVAHLRSDGGHNIFATLSGDKSGLYAPGSSAVGTPSNIVNTAHGSIDPINQIVSEAPPPPWALPLGGNRYHESRDRDGFLRDSDPDLGQLLKEEMVKKIPRDSQSSHKTEARSEHEPSKLSSPSTPLLTHIPHNTMKTIHTNKSQDEISDLEASSRSYWDEIVKLRTMLESRKNGTIALSEADIANMEATEKIMLQHYSEKQKMIASLKGSPLSLKEPIESTQKKVGQVLQKPIQKTSGAQEDLTDRLSASIPSIEKELSSIESTLKTFLAKQRLKDRTQFFDRIEILKDRKNTVSASLKNHPGNTNIQGDLMQIEAGLKAYEEIRELFEKKRVLMQRYRDTLMQKTIYTEFLEKHEIGSWEKAITKLKKLERKKAKIDALPKEANSKAKGAKKLDAFKQAISLHERIQTINSWIKDYDTQTKKVSAPDTSLSTPSDKGGAGHTEAQTDNSSLLRIEHIPQESQKLEEKITENYNFYKRTGDRLYLRFNEEILKDIARIEKKPLAKYQIQEGKVFRV